MRCLATVLFRNNDFHFIKNNMKFTIGQEIVIILLLSHECENWSLILGVKHRLSVNEKIMLLKIFVLKTEDVRKM